MPDDTPNPNQPPAADPTPLPDGQGKNPADQPKGADTPPAKPLEAKPTEEKVDVTTTPEFKDALTKAIAAKMPQLHKQARKDVARELSGEQEGEPTVEELKSKMSTLTTENMQLKARDQLEEFVTDKRNQVQVKNVRGLYKFIKGDLQFDDEGKVTNFKEVIAQAKAEASEFFGGTSTSIDAGNGSRQFATADMNALIRGR